MPCSHDVIASGAELCGGVERSIATRVCLYASPRCGTRPALTFGRNASDDLYADVDASHAFDLKGK